MAFIHSPRMVTDGLVLVYDFANAKSYISGSTIVNNLLPQTITGSFENNPTITFNNCGELNFVVQTPAQQVNSGDIQVLNPELESFSIVVWARVPLGGTTVQCLASKRISSLNGYYLGVINGNTTFITADSTLRRTDCGVGGNITSGSWRMYTGIINREQTTQTIVVDNNQLSTTVNLLGTGSHTSNGQFLIGNANGANPFSGSIGCVMAYRKALTPSEIDQNYNALRARYGV